MCCACCTIPAMREHSFTAAADRKSVDGECKVQPLPREEWHTFLPESHPAYISWEEHERNLRRLRESAQAIGFDRRKSPPREGPALLQGLIVCGKCGRRMTLRYHFRARQVCALSTFISAKESRTPNRFANVFPAPRLIVCSAICCWNW